MCPFVSMTFTKLFSSITESTIWCEDSDTRVVWITFLAMADRRGRVWGAIPGIANRARVSVQVAEAAIAKFLAPDPYSRSNTYDPASEGRRLEVIEGGWRIINHERYRAIRDEEERRAYKADHEAKRRARKRGQNGQICTHVDQNGHNAEAEAEAEVKGQIVPPDMPPLNYAIRIIEDLGMTDTHQNRIVLEAAVKTQIKKGKSAIGAYEFLVAVSKDAQDRGEAVDKFFFEDQKWEVVSGRKSVSNAAGRSERSIQSLINAVRAHRSKATPPVSG